MLAVCMLLTLGSAAAATEAQALQTSERGIAFIQNYESFSPTMYSSGGKWYIGYGTACDAGAYPDGITEEAAEALMLEALQTTEQQVNDFLQQQNITCSQTQFDALVSFTYTLGAEWMDPDYRFASCLIRGLSNCTDLEVVDAMVIWSHVGTAVDEHLIGRRIDEAKLLLYGDYGDGDSPDYTYLILDAAGGTVENDIVCFQTDSAYGTLPTASRTDCEFLGWYLEDGTQLSASSIAGQDRKVQAKWKINEQSPFSDVPTSAWYYSYVAALYQDNVIDGYTDGTFRPTGQVTYGQALKLILVAANYPEQPATGSHWASGYLDLAIGEGIVAQGEIPSLDAAATRLEIARIAAAALQLDAPTGSSVFADTTDPAVLALYEAGVVEGSLVNGQRVYSPDKSISRAEISKIVWQINKMDVPAHVITFGSHTLDILPGVAANQYDAALFQWEDGKIGYHSDQVQTLAGVDVSQFQREIDWEAVKASGVDFAMIRVGGRGYGNGALYEDTHFEQNIEGALDAGLEVGVYFFSQAISVEEAEEEAAYLLERIEGYEISFPVVFDWEVIGKSNARADNLDTDTLGACANAFCEAVAAAGYEPMVYVSLNTGYLKYDLRQIDQYDLWLAEYADAPTFHYNFQMWQYTSSGQVDGIDGEVDLNLSFVNYAEQ